jgi:uncharacterized protein YceK
MKFVGIVLMSLAFTLLLAGCLTLFSQEKFSENQKCSNYTYKYLLEYDQKIDALQKIKPTELKIDDQKRLSILSGRIRFIDKNDIPLKDQYYQDGNLLGIDNLDGQGDKVRRDIFDGDTICIEFFYDKQGNRIYQRFRSKKGDIVASKSLLVPPMPIFTASSHYH